jgi:hypothetical protein
MKRLVIHVDRLILRGFNPGDGGAVAASLQRELRRGLLGPDAATHLASRENTARLVVPKMRVSERAQPRGIGALAARGIARGLKS